MTPEGVYGHLTKSAKFIQSIPLYTRHYNSDSDSWTIAFVTNTCPALKILVISTRRSYGHTTVNHSRSDRYSVILFGDIYPPPT